MGIYDEAGTYYYTNAGTNTLTQVTANPTYLYHLSVANTGGSVGYLHVYNNGSADAGAGTPDLTFPVPGGTADREIDFPNGIRLDGGCSILWAVGATGTVAHGANANVNAGFSRFV